MTQSPERLASHRLATQARFTIARHFDAAPALVWACFTDCAHVARWWGPTGFVVTHCTLDPKPGGRFHYAVESPNGTVLWAKWDYLEVEAPRRLTALSAFSDPLGGTTRNPWAPDWPLETHCLVTFDAEAEGTRVTIEATPYGASEHEATAFLAGHESMTGGYGEMLERLVTHLKSI